MVAEAAGAVEDVADGAPSPTRFGVDGLEVATAARPVAIVGTARWLETPFAMATTRFARTNNTPKTRPNPASGDRLAVGAAAGWPLGLTRAGVTGRRTNWAWTRAASRASRSWLIGALVKMP